MLSARGIGVSDLTRPIAQRAGHLLARLKLSSAHAIDAFVVATALEFEKAIIATGDPSDIQRLASPFRHVRIFALRDHNPSVVGYLLLAMQTRRERREHSRDADSGAGDA